MGNIERELGALTTFQPTWIDEFLTSAHVLHR
jgi:hypothetical protein